MAKGFETNFFSFWGICGCWKTLLGDWRDLEVFSPTPFLIGLETGSLKSSSSPNQKLSGQAPNDYQEIIHVKVAWCYWTDSGLKHKGEWSYIMCKKTDAIGNYPIKQVMSISEKQVSYISVSFVDPRFYIDTWNHVCIDGEKVEGKLYREIKGTNGWPGVEGCGVGCCTYWRFRCQMSFWTQCHVSEFMSPRHYQTKIVQNNTLSF